jgi:hypothetical protein
VLPLPKNLSIGRCTGNFKVLRTCSGLRKKQNRNRKEENFV